jgi:carbon-monoxide dehydrogenase medium subunit
MKPAAFAYYDPTTQAEALELLGEMGEEAKVMAGGQSLMPMLNMRLARPPTIIDINQVSELAYLKESEDGLLIGALTRQRVVEHSEVVRRRAPLLAEAILSIGHPPIRSRGTIGGSLAHADPAAELPAVLLALDGWVQASSPRGTRRIPAAELFVGPLMTSLESDELLTEASFPALPPGTGTSFLEVTRRHGDFALVGVAACLTLDQQGVCTRASIALLGAGETQARAAEAEACLVGQPLNEKAIGAAGAAAMAALEPMGDIHASPAYRKQVAGVLTRRALGIAWERARGVGHE